MSAASEAILRLLFSDAGLFGIGLLTAKLTLPVISLGRIRVLPISSPHVTGRLPDGKFGIAANLAAVIGVLMLGAFAYGAWRVFS